MRIRRKYWFVPALAVLGILFALMHFYYKPKIPEDTLILDPKEIPPPLPVPAPLEKAPAASPPPAPVLPPASRNGKSRSNEEVAQLRTEIKISMAALYGSQAAFFAEYKRYTTDFNALGYSPEGRFLKIKVGFLSPYYPATKEVSSEDPSFMSFDEMVRKENGHAFSPEVERVAFSDVAKYCQAGCTASEKHFEIVSAVNLDDDPELEVWAINEKKVLTQLNNDLANQNH